MLTWSTSNDLIFFRIFIVRKKPIINKKFLKPLKTVVITFEAF